MGNRSILRGLVEYCGFSLLVKFKLQRIQPLVGSFRRLTTDPQGESGHVRSFYLQRLALLSTPRYLQHSHETRYRTCPSRTGNPQEADYHSHSRPFLANSLLTIHVSPVAIFASWCRADFGPLSRSCRMLTGRDATWYQLFVDVDAVMRP